MGPDHFRRWMDMFFWWLPRGGTNPDETKASRSQTKEQPGQQSGEPDRPSPSSSAAATEQQPAEQPVEPPHAPPAQEPAAADKSTANEAADDLTQLKGIGPAMAARLQDMGITTFDSLAAADSKTVTRSLRDKSVVISEKKVEAWIAAAKDAT